MKTSALMRRAYRMPPNSRKISLGTLYNMVLTGHEDVEAWVFCAPNTEPECRWEKFSLKTALRIFAHVENKLQGGNKK